MSVLRPAMASPSLAAASGVALRASTTISKPTKGVPLSSVNARPCRTGRQGISVVPWASVPAGDVAPRRSKLSRSKYGSSISPLKR